jgi:hypothetical protein
MMYVCATVDSLFQMVLYRAIEYIYQSPSSSDYYESVQKKKTNIVRQHGGFDFDF